MLDIYEYETTNGSYVRVTSSTKLGLYPSYEPEIYIDNTVQIEAPEPPGAYKLYGVAGENSKRCRQTRLVPIACYSEQKQLLKI